MSAFTTVRRRSLICALVAAAFIAGLLLQGAIVRAQESTNSADVAAEKVAIIELANRFENTFDDGDLDANAEMWTDDGVFENSAGTFEGKDAIRAWAEQFYGMAASADGGHHLLTNFEIEVDGDTAEMTSYLTLIISVTSPNPSVISSEFTDRLVKVDGEWKFQHRRLEMLTQIEPPPSDGATPAA